MTGLTTDDFNYDLPESLIAQTPLEKRDASRLLVYRRHDGGIEHRAFSDLIEYLDEKDVLVLNDTRVLPARLLGNRPGHEGRVELLLLKEQAADIWQCLCRPARKLKVGTWLEFGGGRLRAEVLQELPDGMRTVRLQYSGVFEQVLDAVGTMPLPPYIHQVLSDAERYQTVYASHAGSAAAPTAGLHFTPELLRSIERKGVRVVRVLLHVGLGTFRPVAVRNISEHTMHSEYYELSPAAAEAINAARAAGGRVVAVGTTSARTLESCADPAGQVQPGSGWTQIFIYPGYTLRAVDALVTNFHLPKSTLLMMISAFAGREQMLHAYTVAVQRQYRFFSFGDAMLLL